MKRMQLLFTALMMGMHIQAHYFYPGRPDNTLYVLMEKQKLQEMQALRKALAVAPVQVATYHHYHNDQSTTTQIDSMQGDVRITHTTYAGSGFPDQKKTEAPRKDMPAPTLWQRWKGMFSRSEGIQAGSSEYFFTNKRDITYKMLIAGYLYVNYRLFRLHMYLDSPSRWYAWKSEKSLPELMEIPQDELAQELITAINRRYKKLENVTESSGPLAEFMKDVEEEMAMLNNYQTITNILLKVDDIEHRCMNACCNCVSKVLGFSPSMIVSFLASKLRVKSLFYVDDLLINVIQNRLSRIAYLKNIFVQWLASFKVAEARQLLKCS